MFMRWLENEPKVTGIFAVISAVALALSLSGVGKDLFVADVAWIAIILCGVPILVGVVKGVVFEHDIKADALVAMALVASVLTREFFAAGEVALIMQIGSLLEDYTSGKAREGIEKLIRLTPQTARILSDGAERIVPAEQVAVGETLRILAGETIPVDGVILTGETTIDQSVMTGESIPVDKKAGDVVASGTVNRYGTFTMRAVTALVVFCPCAFILATPTAVLAGIGNAAKYGIILRSGDALERFSRIRRVAFDKTGTLTYGEPEVSGVTSVDSGYTKEEILRIAASAEQLSEHPLGKAIVKGVGDSLAAVQDFQMVTGQGITALVENKTVSAGKADFMEKQGISLAAAQAGALDSMAQGATVIYVAIDDKLAGYISLADTLRKDAAQTVRRLKEAHVLPLLLTGDNEARPHILPGRPVLRS